MAHHTIKHVNTGYILEGITVVYATQKKQLRLRGSLQKHPNRRMKMIMSNDAKKIVDEMMALDSLKVLSDFDIEDIRMILEEYFDEFVVDVGTQQEDE